MISTIRQIFLSKILDTIEYTDRIDIQIIPIFINYICVFSKNSTYKILFPCLSTADKVAFPPEPRTLFIKESLYPSSVCGLRPRM